MNPTPGEEKTTPEMKPITFMPTPPPGTDMPPAETVKCGMRNTGGCIKDGRIVNGQEAGVRTSKILYLFHFFLLSAMSGPGKLELSKEMVTQSQPVHSVEEPSSMKSKPLLLILSNSVCLLVT